jgi:hypothetical protein
MLRHRCAVIQIESDEHRENDGCEFDALIGNAWSVFLIFRHS